MSSERIPQLPLSMTSLYNPKLLTREPLQPTLQQPPRVLEDGLQLNMSSHATQQRNMESATSIPGSPVKTDLALGSTMTKTPTRDDAQEDGLKDFLSCISVESKEKPVTPIPEDVDSFKRLLKGLIGKVWWQTDAASSVASTVTKCRLGNGKRRIGGSKGDIWMLFSGPDRIGKRKMAAALSDFVCGVGPIIISLGSRRDDETDLNFRGKTVIDRIVEAIRRNPFSVIMLQDVDEADLLVRGSIKRAMERGRISDSHGREINLGNIIFILTSNWVPEQLRDLSDGVVTLNEEKMTSLARGGWQLRVSIGEKATSTGKRSSSWLNKDDQDREAKQRKEELGSGLSFDLNQMADINDDSLHGSHSSNDLTVEDENQGSLTTSAAPPKELLASLDDAIFFKVVDFKLIRQNTERSILAKFSSILGDNSTLSIKIDSEALEKILSGIWLGETTLESWLEKALVPSIRQIKAKMSSMLARSPDATLVARIELDYESESRNPGDWLPGTVSVVSDAQ